MPKNLWKYLGFIFNRKLSFHQHIDYYLNKAISTVKCMKLLGNLLCGIILTQSVYSIGAASYPSHYMAINYGSITMPLYCTIWKSCGKCKEELLYGYLELLKHLQLKALKWLQELFPSNYTFKNSWIDHNYIHSLYPLTTLFEHLWMIFLVRPFTNIQPHSTISPVAKGLLSKVIWSIQTTKCMEFFLHFLLCTQNFFWVLESLTIFQTAFLSTYLIKKKKMIQSAFNNFVIRRVCG